MASKIVEAVRNSPIIGRKGGYSPITTHNSDPFVQGIPFQANYIASIEVPDRVGTDNVHRVVNKALDEAQKSKKDTKKVTIIVKAISLTVRDIHLKSEVSYPIYMVSYCGNARDADIIFFFIHKNQIDQKIRAEIFKCSTAEKVLAITRTISKAFSIAYKAWQTKKRQEQRQSSPRSSPLLNQKTAKDKDTVNLGRTALEKAAASTGGYYTPPIPRKSPEKGQNITDERPRSGSLGDDDVGVAKMVATLKIPALEKVKVKNETSGKQLLTTVFIYIVIQFYYALN